MSVMQYGEEIATLTGKYAMVAARLPRPCRVLDVGCYTGGLLASLNALGHCVIGIEADPQAAGIAESLGVPVLRGDIEDTAWIATLELEADVILLLDVLEHLRDPALVLRQLRRFLSDGGRLLVTGPNVAYWSLRKSLLLGRWDYGDAGSMDHTHLRFFTRKTWIALLEGAGYKVLAVESVDALIPLQSRFQRSALVRSALAQVASRAVKLWPGLFSLTFLIEAKPTT